MENEKLKNAPKLSVIIPVFGVEKYIERCARCLFEQTLDDIEYLFIDDCTPDKSIEILRNVLEDYPHRKELVIIHRMEQNSGQAIVRRWGMEHATGEYVIHCDSDDWVDRDMYRQMIEKAEAEDADVVLCGFARSDGKTILNKQDDAFITESGEKDRLIAALLTGRDLSSLCNKAVKSTLFHREDFLYATKNMWEDFVYSFQFFLNANKVSIVDKYMYYYYQNSDSICGQVAPEKIEGRFLQIKENVQTIEQLTIEREVYNKYKEYLVPLKYKAKSELLPLVGTHKYWREWKRSFSEINCKILSSKYISDRSKLKFMMTMIGIYPLVCKLILKDSKA